MNKQVIDITTAADGSASITGNVVSGKLYAVEYQPGSIETGATIVLTCEGVGSKPLLTKANAGTAVLVFYPRDLVHAVVDGAPLTGTAGGDRTMPLLSGVLKAVISSGGNAKSGRIIAYFEG